MKHKNVMTLQETWLKVLEMISDQESDKYLCVWTWSAQKYENTFYVSC